MCGPPTVLSLPLDLKEEGGTAALSIATSGNVGIGDVSPDHKLDVAGNIGLNAGGYLNWGDTDGSSGYGIRDNSGTIEFKNSGGTWGALGQGGDKISEGNSSVEVVDTGSGRIVFTTDGSEAVRIDCNGKVGVGTTSPGAGLDVQTNNADGYAASFLNDGDAANRYGLKVQCGYDSGNSCNILEAFDGNGTAHGYLQIELGTFELEQASDGRRKTAVKDSDSVLPTVRKLRVVDYRHIKGGEMQKGLIAQEVHKVFPLAATYHERDDLWTLSYNRFIPLLIKAVQELEHKVGSV